MLPKKKALIAVGIALSTSLSGCGDGSPKPLMPDMHPAGTSVTLSYRGSEFVLGPKSAQMFLEMLAKTPIRSQISTMRARPWGEFVVDRKKYYWHGNAVIRGSEDDERLWHGPLMQRLINDTRYLSDLKQVQVTLDKIENDPTVSKTPLEGPGAYPGSGDALHPITVPQSR